MTSPTREAAAGLVERLKKPAPPFGMEEYDPTYDLRQEAATALETAEQAAWRPIEEAPRIPDQRLDLWVVQGKPMWGERGKPYREANARLSGNGKHWIGADGRYIEGLRTYDNFDPDDRSPDATIITHFRPLPTPPGEQG